MTSKKVKPYLPNYPDEVNNIADNLRLMDDDFMKSVFHNNTRDTELVLRIILDDASLSIKWVDTEEKLHNLFGHSIEMDILAVDSNDVQHDIEIQKAEEPFYQKRARYYSSIIDTNSFCRGLKYEELPETCVIYFAEHDIPQKGLPIYHIERTFSEYSLPFEDGSRIIYVNGQYKGNDPIGRLIHDFWCVEPEDMYYEELRETVSRYKYTKEGKATVCKAVEEYGKKQKAQMIDILKLLLAGVSPDDIRKQLDCPIEDIESVRLTLAHQE